ncbi:S41 family peptidase [bacterium]|nr:S41 family peptidase [bacterium]
MMVFIWAAYLAGAASASTGGRDAWTINQLSQIRNERSGDLFNKAMRILESDYYMPIDEEAKTNLVYGAIQGMVNELRKEPFNDNFSHFYDPELYKDLDAQTSGEYAGIGILMGTTPDGFYPEISSVFPNTPAEEAGIEPQDIITAVDDEDTFGMILPEVATRIKGKEETKVKLTVYRATENEYYDFTVERREVSFSSISDIKMLDGTTGFLRINNFGEQTDKDFFSAVDELLEQGMQALVIDLRNNSGGLMKPAVDIAERFIDEGVVVEIVERNDEHTAIYANPDVKKYDLPLVVLINENSASASEILVGALKDHGLATIVGTQSYGKGVIQAVTPMEKTVEEMKDEDGQSYKQEVVKDALAITIGKYMTPNGHDIHGVGIEPDIWFTIDNRLQDEPELKRMEQVVREKTEELRQLRAELIKYVRDNDTIVDKATDVADRLARGEEVPDEGRVEPEAEEHMPVAAMNNGADHPEENETEEPDTENEEQGE